MEQLSDEELVARYRAHNGAASDDPHINELFRRHYRRVALWCLRFTGDRESAADLAQEIFTSVYRRLDSFQGNSRFTTWLYAVSRNHCLNELRSRATRHEETAELVFFELAESGAESPLERLEHEGAVRVARQILEESLDGTEKAVFTLHYGEDLPLNTITRLLGLENPSGAKAYIVSARRKLATAVRRWKARHETAR